MTLNGVGDKNTDAEIRDGVWSDGTKPNGAYLDQKISEAGGGIDWSSKTPSGVISNISIGTRNTKTTTLVSGSGFLIGIGIVSASGMNAQNLVIDGTNIPIRNPMTNEKYIPCYHRFESSVAVEIYNNSYNNTRSEDWAVLTVLD